MTVETATQILEDLSLKDDKNDKIDKSDKNDSTLSQSPKSQFAKRRRPWAPRTIPRDNLGGKDSGRKRTQRRRNESEVSSRQNRRNVRGRTTSEVSTMSESTKEALPMRKLSDTIMEKYEKKGSNLFASFLKNRRELANFENKTKFLQQCKAVEVVPMPYRLTNFNIKNTKVIRRILDKFSLQLMFADLNYCRKRCDQIKKLLAERIDLMKELFDDELVATILTTTEEAFQRRSQQLQERDGEVFKNLVSEYNLTEEDIKAGDERLKVFEQLDKERHERRLQRQQEKEQKTDDNNKTEDKPTESETETEGEKKSQD